MTSHHSVLLLLSVVLCLRFTLSLAQVPANETFFFLNEGEFGDRIIEYDASYRVIRNNTRTFLSRPFRLCFYNTTPGEYVFAIRAGLPNDEDLMRWVWDANRHQPVHENSTLSFGRDGNFVLAEADGRVVWQTNTAGRGKFLRLLDNGNLVVIDKKGNFVWQSFDHPVDTLLVGQSVKINGRNKLVSRVSDADPSDGIYSIVLEKTGFNMYVNNSGQLLIYGGWRTDTFGPNITFGAVPVNENATAYELALLYHPPDQANRRRLLQSRPIGGSGQINLNKINYNGTYSFLRIGSDGNLKAFTYYNPVEYLKWDETFSFFSDYFVRKCGRPAFCGKFGLCDRGMCIACPTRKGLLGWSEECAPPKAPSCKSGAAAADYYKVVGVEHFSSPYKEDGEGPIKVEKCKEKCSADCKCLGFIYKEDTLKCLRFPLIGTLIKDKNATSVGYIKYAK